VHATIAAGAGTELLLVFGPALLVVWPLVALIAWSRVQVGDHTPAQVLAGVALALSSTRRPSRCCSSQV
jgi:membrane-associated phospholipid phosphatase